MVDPATLIQFTANGVVLGAILTLTAIGLTLVYGILNLANFAHGDLITLGAYLGIFFVALLDPGTQAIWAVGAVALAIALVTGDRFLRGPAARWSAGSRWSVSPHRALGTGEERALLYGAALLLALLASTRWPVDHGLEPLALLQYVILGLAALGLLLRRWPRLLRDPRAQGLAAAAGLALAYVVGSDHLLGFVLAIVGVAVISMALDVVMWRPLRSQGAGLLTLIIVSIGLALALRNLILVRFGAGLQSFPGAPQRARRFLGGWVSLTPTQMIVILVALVAIVLVHLLLQRTKMGKAMRALSDNMDLARIAGIDVDRVILYVWAIAAGLAALSGILLGEIRTFNTNLGWFLLLPIFAAVILGGIGSPYGAMAGGFTIGIAMEVSPAIPIPGLFPDGVPNAYKPAVGFLILILVLLVRPQGIFGKEVTR